jgi:hypothetical protein
VGGRVVDLQELLRPEGALARPTLPLRRTAVVDLNRLTLRLSTNAEQSPVYGYFSRFAPPDTAADYELVCVDLDIDEVDPALLTQARDRSTRAQRFATGYYRGPYFGAPAHLLTRDRTTYVFGRRLDRIVWPYAVKHLLTVFAADHGYLHLKAGGFVRPDGQATLLVGRTGGGKTVFLAEACRAGASVLANTHVLVRDGVAHGVPSAVRVRADARFADLARGGELRPHLAPGEYLVAPERLFGAERLDAPVRDIVITNFRPGRPPRFEQVAAETALAFLDQFAFAVTSYGLKDDLLHHLDYDLAAYAAVYQAGRDQLVELCRRARCFVAGVDLLDAGQRERVLAAL